VHDIEILIVEYPEPTLEAGIERQAKALVPGDRNGQPLLIDDEIERA